MKIQILAVLLGLAITSAAKAETFTCGFTEPFLTMTYQTGTEILTKKDESTGKVVELHNVSFLILSSGQYSLRNSAGTEVARLTLDGKGSDGMSNIIYPYSVTTNLISGANDGIGGCSSVALKIKQGQD